MTVDHEKNSKSYENSTIKLKDVLKALSNPVRLQILSRLTGGDKYVLQLVKEIAKPQQVIHRHVNYLEDLGIVESYRKSYDEYKESGTPPSRGRKYFRITSQFILNLLVGPTVFRQFFHAYDGEQNIDLPEEFKKKIDSISPSEPSDSLSELSHELFQIKHEIAALHEKQAEIFFKQAYIQDRINEDLEKISLNFEERQVLNILLGAPSQPTKKISKDLNIHPDSAKKILEALKKRLPLVNEKGLWFL